MLMTIFHLSGMEHNSVQYLHHLIEAIQIAFADGLHFIADSSDSRAAATKLLSKEYAAKRRQLIHNDR